MTYPPVVGICGNLSRAVSKATVWSQLREPAVKKVSSFESYGTRSKYTMLRGERSIFLTYFEVNSNHRKPRHNGGQRNLPGVAESR